MDIYTTHKTASFIKLKSVGVKQWKLNTHLYPTCNNQIIAQFTVLMQHVN